MAEHDDRRVEFSRLNWVGKGVFIAGSAFRVALGLIDATVETVGGIITEAERAFSEGIDPDVDDAKILDEKDGPRSRRDS